MPGFRSEYYQDYQEMVNHAFISQTTYIWLNLFGRPSNFRPEHRNTNDNQIDCPVDDDFDKIRTNKCAIVNICGIEDL